MAMSTKAKTVTVSKADYNRALKAVEDANRRLRVAEDSLGLAIDRVESGLEDAFELLTDSVADNIDNAITITEKTVGQTKPGAQRTDRKKQARRKTVKS
jgi:hypothetical protein